MKVSKDRRDTHLNTTPYDVRDVKIMVPTRMNSKKYSLHITNLPHSTDQNAVHRYFANEGCRVYSTRLVYNHHISNRERLDEKKKTNTINNGFTGVAFIDVADKQSYENALTLDKGPWKEDGVESIGWRGRVRRINVRPTRTKEELAKIVEDTKVKQEKLKENKKKGDGEANEKHPKSQERKRNNSLEDNKHVVNEKRQRESTSLTGGNKRMRPSGQQKSQKEKANKKLTKKERAKKAQLFFYQSDGDKKIVTYSTVIKKIAIYFDFDYLFNCT